jgi:hypothetical protein
MANEYAIPSTLDAVLATSLADYSGTVTDNVYNQNVVLSQLNKSKRLIDGGLSVVYPLIKGDQNDGGFYSGAGLLNTQQTDQETLVEYRWQNLYEPIQLTRDEERQNSGDMHKIVDLVGEKIQRSELAIAKRAEQAMSTAVAGAGYLVDLETLVNTGTLGTIAGGTDTFWQSTVTASGSFAAQGLSDMATAYYAVSSAENTDNPTIILTNKTIFQYFENTRLPLERIENGNLSANAGFKNLTFKGIPLTYGNYIGSGLMFGLNMNYVDYNVDSMTDFAMTPFLMPVNQTAKVAFILHRTTGPVTNNRRRHFKLTGISA